MLNRHELTHRTFSRRRALAVVLGLVAAGLACFWRQPPNLLFITVDTIRADHCSVYGYPRPTTPTLESVAREGTRFDEAYAPMATTGPSHATMFTSLYPLTHGVVKNGYRLDEESVTLAEVLSAAGYQTAAVVSSFAVHGKFGLSQGFTFYDDEFEGSGEFKARDWEGHLIEGGFDQDARVTTREAALWLSERREADRPFFLWVHYFDPHSPYRPPAPYDTTFAPPDGGEDALARTIVNYDGEIRETDEAIGRLLESLHSEGLDHSTLLIIAGDHGEGLMQHGHMTHGLHIYEEAVRVPLIFRWPDGLPSNRRLSGPVELVDLMPTILELLDVSSPALTLQGTSLVPVLEGSKPLDSHREVYLQRRHYETGKVGNFAATGEKFGIRSGGWKYIVAADEGTYELFDLSRDPAETTNLYSEHPDEAHRLARRLRRWRRDLADQRLKSSGEISPEDTKRLESLGYVQ